MKCLIMVGGPEISHKHGLDVHALLRKFTIDCSV